jgi:hypothetical protein
MIRLAVAGLVLAVPLLAQEKPKLPKPQRQAAPKPADQQEEVKKPELPPFPTSEAQWVIRGSARADAFVSPRSLPISMQALTPFPHELSAQLPDARRLCNTMDHTLPSVFVYVKSLETCWRFPLSEDTKTVELLNGRFVPHVGGVTDTCLLYVRNHDSRAAELRIENRGRNTASENAPTG